MNTIASIADAHGVDVTTARLRCEGLTIDHVGNNAQLTEAAASLIAAAVARPLA